ncbi:MAG: site-specific integrase [Anaerolineales bacterium]
MYLADLSSFGRRPATLSYYRQKLVPFLGYLGESGVMEPAQIQRNHIRVFMLSLAETHTPGGCAAYWRAIRAFVRFLIREGDLDHNLLEGLRSPRVDQIVQKPVPVEDVAAMVAACPKTEAGLRDASIFCVLLDAGLRAGEVLALNVQDVDFVVGTITVRCAKNRTPRQVACGAHTRKALVKYLRLRPGRQPEDPLWTTSLSDGSRHRLTYAGLRSIVQRRARKAQVPVPTLHSFRRAYALEMLRNGCDVMTLSHMMGHGSLTVLKRYLDLQADDLARVQQACSPVDHMLGRRTS